MNTAAALVAGASAVAAFAIVVAVVVGFRLLARWMARLEARDLAKAEAEGFAACRRGDSASANPYVCERSERFRAMATAWTVGFTRAMDERNSI